MILVDTSVWIDHLRRREPALDDFLSTDQVLLHPYVIGEIALGSIAQRELVIDTLSRFPQAPVATALEVLALIDGEGLHGIGIGYVDAHLLAAVRLAGAQLWTRDRRLHSTAERLGLAARPGISL